MFQEIDVIYTDNIPVEFFVQGKYRVAQNTVCHFVVRLCV